MTLIFFFSSRRRHTRWTGDWSSDVCSSDLGARRPHRAPRGAPGRRRQRGAQRGGPGNALRPAGRRRRSEERRVGKGGRWWWWALQYRYKSEEVREEAEVREVHVHKLIMICD